MPFLKEKVEEIKRMITESIEIERFKVDGVEGMYNYKVHFNDGRSLEFNFDKIIKKEYVSNPSFKIYLDGKLLDFEVNETNSIYLFTRDFFHKKNK